MTSGRSVLAVLAVLLTVSCCCCCCCEAAAADVTQNQLEVPPQAHLKVVMPPQAHLVIRSDPTPVTLSPAPTPVPIPVLPPDEDPPGPPPTAAAAPGADERETVHPRQPSGHWGPVAALRLTTERINVAIDASRAREGDRSHDLSPPERSDAASQSFETDDVIDGHGTGTGAAGKRDRTDQFYIGKTNLQSTTGERDQNGEVDQLNERRISLHTSVGVSAIDRELEESRQGGSDSDKDELSSNLVFIERGYRNFLRSAAVEVEKDKPETGIEIAQSSPIVLSAEHSLLNSEHQGSERLSEEIRLENILPQAGKDLRRISNAAAKTDRNSLTQQVGAIMSHETRLTQVFHTELNSQEVFSKNSKRDMIIAQKPPGNSISGIKTDNGIAHLSDHVASAKTEASAVADPFHKPSGSVAGYVRSHAPWGRVRPPPHLIGQEAVNDVRDKVDPSPAGAEPGIGRPVTDDVTGLDGGQARFTASLLGSVTNPLLSRAPPERVVFPDSDLDVPRRTTGETGTPPERVVFPDSDLDVPQRNTGETGTPPRPENLSPRNSAQSLTDIRTNASNLKLGTSGTTMVRPTAEATAGQSENHKTTEATSQSTFSTGQDAEIINAETSFFSVTGEPDKSGATKREVYYPTDVSALSRSHLPSGAAAHSSDHRENVTTAGTTSQLREAISEQTSNQLESHTAGSATHRRPGAVPLQTTSPTATAAAILSETTTTAPADGGTTTAAVAAATAVYNAVADDVAAGASGPSSNSAKNAEWDDNRIGDGSEHEKLVHDRRNTEGVTASEELAGLGGGGKREERPDTHERRHAPAWSWSQGNSTSPSLPLPIQGHPPTLGDFSSFIFTVTNAPHSTSQNHLYPADESVFTANSEIYTAHALPQTTQTQLHPDDETSHSVQPEIDAKTVALSSPNPETHEEEGLSKKNEMHAEDEHPSLKAGLEVHPVDRYRYGPPRVAISNAPLPTRYRAPLTVLRSQVHGEPRDRYRPPLPDHHLGHHGSLHYSPAGSHHSPHGSPAADPPAGLHRSPVAGPYSGPHRGAHSSPHKGLVTFSITGRSPQGSSHHQSHHGSPFIKQLYPLIRPIPRPSMSPFVSHAEELEGPLEDHDRPLEESDRPLHLVIRSTSSASHNPPRPSKNHQSTFNNSPKPPRPDINAKLDKLKRKEKPQKLALYGDFNPVYISVNHYIIPPTHEHTSPKYKPTWSLHIPDYVKLSSLQRPPSKTSSVDTIAPFHSYLTKHKQGTERPFVSNEHVPVKISIAYNSRNNPARIPIVRNYVAPSVTNHQRRSLPGDQPVPPATDRLQRSSSPNSSQFSFSLPSQHSSTPPPHSGSVLLSHRNSPLPSPRPQSSSAIPPHFPRPSQFHSHLPSPTTSSPPTALSVTTTDDQTASSILELLQKANATTLIHLLKMAELDTLLADTGPYTLFAPTEEALNDLVKRLGGLQRMLKKMGKTNLVKLLLYHVMRGFTLEEDLGDNLLGRTLTGSRLRINQHRVTSTGTRTVKNTNSDTDSSTNSSSGSISSTINSNSSTSTDFGSANATTNSTSFASGPVQRTITTVNGARLVAGPQLAENGAVYRVAAVLAPPQTDVLSALRADPKGRFTVLLETLRLAGLYDQLQEYQAGPLTILAPTNAAFASVPAAELRQLLGNRRRLRKLLLSHVIGGSLYLARLATSSQVTTMSRAQVTVNDEQGHLTVDGITVLVPDISTEHGVVHGIGGVIGFLRASPETSSATSPETSSATSPETSSGLPSNAPLGLPSKASLGLPSEASSVA